MKRFCFFLISIISLLSVFPAALAETLAPETIQSSTNIGEFTVATTQDGSYLLDRQNTIIGGPYEVISDYDGFPYAETADGSKVLYDKDGAILGQVESGGEILSPANGIYAIMPDSTDMELCTVFDVYDYTTKTLLHRFDRAFLYYLEQQTEKMFIKKDGKYAICDKYGNFITDYIYDDVKKRFTPDYVPFPKAYAIVIQDGKEKYIDWDLNEITFDADGKDAFVTNAWRMHSAGFENYKEFYVLESSTRLALYDLATEEFLIPYQTQYRFNMMNDTYIIAEKEGKYGVLDYQGNELTPFQYDSLSFSDEGKISYSYFDGESMQVGTLNPADGTQEAAGLGNTSYFYRVLGVSGKDEIAYGTIVFENDRCADISSEDLKPFLDTYWNFSYDRVIAPFSSSVTDDFYIKLWNKDKTKSYTIFSNSGVMAGTFGSLPGQSEYKNYVWYLPYVGNARNALYTANQTLYEKYKDTTRELTPADIYDIPSDETNLLPLEGASDWAREEIQKAAAKNLLLYDLTDQYQQPITRMEFCYLATRLIATKYFPQSDSRIGIWSAIDSIKADRGLTEICSSIQYTDCDDDFIKFLSALDIVKGMDDGTFCPDQAITREEAAAILSRMADFLQYSFSALSDELLYSDQALISDWAKNAVSQMRQTGIMIGTSDSTFSPQEAYTVEQAIATMVRLYEYQ